jgi:Cu/Ag efflux protein CusF
MNRTSRLSATSLAVLACLALACGERRDTPGSASTASATPTPAVAQKRTPAEQTYVLRGRLARLPQPGDSTREITVAHDAIPDFKGSNGNVVGMDAMTMPFEVAPEVSLDGLAAGDAVEMRLELRWASSSPALIAAITKLPADTKLASEVSQ